MWQVLAESAVHFDVVEQLGEVLNLTLPPGENHKYKLYKYTMEERIYPALQTLKACDSVELDQSSEPGVGYAEVNLAVV